MADNTKIEWTDSTWQVFTGCSITSPGCTNCYAMRLAGTRLQHHPSRAGLTTMSKAGPVWTGEVRFNRQWLDQPLRWKRPRAIFVCAHGDLFHENVPDAWLDEVFAVMALAPQHLYQVLTKRPARMRDYLSDAGVIRRVYETVCDMAVAMRLNVTLIADRTDEPNAPPGRRIYLGQWPLANVWLGTSVEDQTRADERQYSMRAIAELGWPTWVSYEPAIGPVDWAGWEFLRWIVSGGESGAGARLTHPDWHRATRDFCADIGAAYHFKQNGAFKPTTVTLDEWLHQKDEMRLGERVVLSGGRFGGFPEHGVTEFEVMRLVGKKAAGRLLDGVEHNGMPELRQ